MMDNNFKGGVWPVMLTPFSSDGKSIDFNALGELIEWYIKNGVSGLFAVCQSSEMFLLSLEERIAIAKFCVERSAGRVSVIASGHISDAIDDQISEVIDISKTGVDAVILITNRLATEEEDDEVWLNNANKLLLSIPSSIKLGLYECPYPYKRVLSEKMIKFCADSERFYFLKDTSCDINNIKMKLEAIKGSNLKLYNANTATLLESLKLGAKGYSGVMANSQCKLYTYLLDNYDKPKAQSLSDFLTICAWMEYQYYPVNAKYYLQLEGLPINLNARVQDCIYMTDTLKKEIKALQKITINKLNNL